ncbi:transposase [Streptomyces syringium]|uniref:transposase n=1 Tax=Streptomyces syringium TaxID=76729 RepID=UPI00343C86F5
MLPVAGADQSKRLVPDELRQPAAPLLPPFPARPQGRRAAPCDKRAVYTAVVYVLTSGGAWRSAPTFATSPATAHRRFAVRTTSHSSAAYPPSGPAGDHGGAYPSNSARTRRTSVPNPWPGCASAGSPRASHGPASSPANALVGRCL